MKNAFYECRKIIFKIVADALGIFNAFLLLGLILGVMALFCYVDMWICFAFKLLT